MNLKINFQLFTKSSFVVSKQNMLNIEPTTQADINTKTSSNNSDKEQEQDNGNPVWEEISPLIWRDAIYSEAAKDTIMGKLFADEITLFQDTLKEI